MHSGAEEQRSTAVRILQRDAAEGVRKHWEVVGRPREDHTPDMIEEEESLASHSSCWTTENANPSPGLKHHRQREHLFLMGEVGGGEERIGGEEDRHEDEGDTKEERHVDEDSDGQVEDGNTLEVVTAAGVLGAAGQECLKGSPFARHLADCHSSWSIPCQ